MTNTLTLGQAVIAVVVTAVVIGAYFLGKTVGRDEQRRGR